MKIITFTGLDRPLGKVVETTFAEFYEGKLKKHRPLFSKKFAELFSLAAYNGDTRRNDFNVKGMNGAVLDFDDGANFEDIERELEDIEYCAYSTYSHSSNCSKFRVVIPFTHTISTQQWQQVYRELTLDKLGNPKGLDSASKKLSQPYFFPSCPEENLSIAWSKYNAGKTYNPEIGEIENEKNTKETNEKRKTINNTPEVGFSPMFSSSSHNGGRSTSSNSISSDTTPISNSEWQSSSANPIHITDRQSSLPSPQLLVYNIKSKSKGRNEKLGDIASAMCGKKDFPTALAELIAEDQKFEHPLFETDEESRFIKGRVEHNATIFLTNHWHSIEQTYGEKAIYLPTEQVELEQQETKIEAIDLVDFLQMELPKPEVILEPWLFARSINMIHAYRGVGKTHCSLNIAYAVATGTSFLKWNVPKPQKIFYIDGEMMSSELQSRLYEINKYSEVKPQAGFFNFLTPDMLPENMTLDMNSKETRNLVSKAIQKKDAQLIIVDNISCLFSGEDENDAKSWQAGQEWSLKMKKQGRTVLFVHHSGKGNNQRGTSKKEDIMHTVINLSRPEGYEAEQGCRFLVTFEKSRAIFGKDVAQFEVMLETDENSKEWVIIGEGKTKKQMDRELMQQIVALQEARKEKKEKEFSQRKIGEIFNIGREKVRILLKKIKEEEEFNNTLKDMENKKGCA